MLSGLFGDFMQTVGSSQRIFDLIDNKKPKIPHKGCFTPKLYRIMPSNFRARFPSKISIFRIPQGQTRLFLKE